MARSEAKKRSFSARLQDNAVAEYLRGTRAELRKVHWPTREEAKNLTKIVLAVTVSMAAFMGLLDYLFSMELRGLISGDPIAIGIAIFVFVGSIVAAVIVNRQMA
ncbi:MAG: preprotein translocase subunit SecE [Chloroflexota bacterium]|nr:preprotein translocase subunit SecE [Chloroflexota bacterium]